MSKLEICVRAALNIAAFIVIAAGLNKWIIVVFFLISVVATAELGIRPYGRDSVEKLLLGCGAIAVTLILIGLCLNFTPWGLTREMWAIAWLVVTISVLIWRRNLGAAIESDIRSLLSRHWMIALYGIAAMTVLVVAVGVAFAGVRVWNQKAVLSFSLVSKSANKVVVRIGAVSTTGTYRIEAQSGSPHARRYLSQPISVNAGGGGQVLDEMVPVNVSGRWIINLINGNHSSGLRELIVDVG